MRLLLLLLVITPFFFRAQVLVMETGQVSLTHVLQSVSLNNTFVDPVVIAMPPSYIGSHEATVRVANVTSSSFDIYLEEPVNRDNSHTTETVHYIVVEKGEHLFSDGTYIEAGVVSSINDFGFHTVNFSQTYSSIPACFSQIQTDNSSTQFLHTRQQNSTTSSFNLRLEREESLKNVAPTSGEDIGYVIISSGNGALGGVNYESGIANGVDEATHTQNFTQTLSSGLHFISSIATYNGGDAVVMRWINLNATSVSFFLDEETSNDAETNHTTETVNYFAINDNSGGGIYRPFALPVKLLNFNAYMTEDYMVRLEWKTVSEINNDYFIIERSVDGVNWEEVLREEGAVNSNNIISYEGVDKVPYLGLSYYRLKQVDLDGKYTYSNIDVVNIKGKVSEVINIFPNPSNSIMTIQGENFESLDYQFYDLLGNNLARLVKVISSQKDKVIVDISSLPNGTYFLKAKSHFRKIIKY